MRQEAFPSLRGVHVLVVSDDAERRELLEQAITYAGAFTTPADCAARALRVMERLQVNVLVVDAHANARLACIAAVRALPRESGGVVPALALTGAFDDRDALLAAGYQAHLTMPVRGVELCRAIAALAVRAPRA